MRVDGIVGRALEELAWLAFFLPRQGLQSLARRLPLARLRDALPRALSERLRFGLYPARLEDTPARACARAHPDWGDPAGLDPARPVRSAAPPRVSVLMVTYGQLELTRLCLASLQRAETRCPYELIVVDNASPDASASWLRGVEAEGLLPLRVVENRSNRGFGPATNQAAALARGEALVFLNNDTVVVDGWLDGLVALLDRDPSLGLVGPMTSASGNEAALGVQYDHLGQLAGFAAAHARDQAGAPLREVAMLELFCAAMPRALFEAVGGLDERYAVGMFEDDDLSLAVRRAGRRVALAPALFVHHWGGGSFRRLDEARYLRIWWENRRRYQRKWGVAWQPR